MSSLFVLGSYTDSVSTDFTGQHQHLLLTQPELYILLIMYNVMYFETHMMHSCKRSIQM